MDLIGPLPESNGFNAIQVWVDLFTKRIHVEPVDMTLSSEGVARLTRDRIIRYHGIMRKIISDRDKRYISKFMQELNRLLGTQMNPTTAFRPWSDGQTERMNQEIEHYLRIYVNYHQSDWAEWLAMAEFSYNDKVHAATQTSPFFADHGYHPWKGVEGRLESNNETAQEFAQHMKKIREDAGIAMQKAKEKMKKYYDQKRIPAPDFQVGQKVWLEAKNIRQDRPTDKFSDRRLGPFEILEKVGAAAYRLKMPETDQHHSVFNEELLSPYVEPPLHRRELHPPPSIIKGHEEYVVEEILKSRKRGQGYQYLVKWKDYPHSDNTWEPERNLTNAKELLSTFKKRNITTRALNTVPIFPSGYWDQLIDRYKPKIESLPYPTQQLFDPSTGKFENVKSTSMRTLTIERG